MNWEGPTFAYPLVLLGLLALPILAYLRGRRGRAPGIVYSSVEILRAAARVRQSSRVGWKLDLLILSMALFIIALARPQQGRTLTHVEASGIDIMLALDVSTSMLAEDFTIESERVNRLEAVKHVTEKFIKGRPNDRIGIVAFAGKPYLVSPLTLDHDWLLQNLDRLRIGMVEDGTAIGSAIASASNRLKDKEAKSKVVVLLTDGDNTAGPITPITAADAAKVLGIKVYTIGAGTRGLAPFPYRRDEFSGRIYYRQVMVSVDEETLKQIAKATGANFYRATDSESLEQIFQEIDKLEKTEVEMTSYRQYRDLFPWFVGAGCIALLLHGIAGQTLGRKLP